MTPGRPRSSGRTRTDAPEQPGGRFRVIAAPLAVAVSAAIVAWISFGRTDMSLDEGYTVSESKLTFSTLLHVLWGRELNGSLHTVLIWGLTRLPGGDHLTIIRGFSVLCMVAAFVLFFAVLGRFAGFWAAMVGLVFFAANPLVLEEMVDGRTYGLTTLLVVVSIRVLLAATDQESPQLFVVWGVVSGVMLYGHFLTGPIVFAQVIWLFSMHRHMWRRWLPGAAVTSIMALPVVLFLASGGGSQHQLPPSPPKSLRDYVSGVLSLAAGGANGQRAVQFAAVVLVVICLVSALKAPQTRSMATLGVLITALPVFFAVVAAHSSPSIFQPRYLILALPGLAMVVAVGLHSLGWLSRATTTEPARSYAIWVGFPIIIVALVAGGIACERSGRQSSAARHSWSDAAAQVAGEAARDDLVTTMVPFEGNVARLYVTADRLSFTPGVPQTAGAFLAQSTYADRSCPATPTVTGSLWVLSAMSPHFDSDLRKVAACGGLVIASEEQVGNVRVARLAHS